MHVPGIWACDRSVQLVDTFHLYLTDQATDDKNVRRYVRASRGIA